MTNASAFAHVISIRSDIVLMSITEHRMTDGVLAHIESGASMKLFRAEFQCNNCIEINTKIEFVHDICVLLANIMQNTHNKQHVRLPVWTLIGCKISSQ